MTGVHVGITGPSIASLCRIATPSLIFKISQPRCTGLPYFLSSIWYVLTTRSLSNQPIYQKLQLSLLSACSNFSICLLGYVTLHRPSRGLSTKSCIASISVMPTLIASSSPEEHQEHLCAVLECFQEHGVIINPTKCVFGVSQLQFLGHHVDSQGIRPLEEKVSALCQFPQPTTRCRLCEFLGLINFYRRFLPNSASILQPLHDLLSSTTDDARQLQWSNDAVTAFTSIKDALTNITLLFHLKPDAPTCIMTDALSIAVGAVLQQRIGEDWHPISYFSRKLKPSETHYSAFDRELLAVYLAIKHFRYFVEGCTFYILTDHKSLTSALLFHSDCYTPRQV